MGLVVLGLYSEKIIPFILYIKIYEPMIFFSSLTWKLHDSFIQPKKLPWALTQKKEKAKRKTLKYTWLNRKKKFCIYYWEFWLILSSWVLYFRVNWSQNVFHAQRWDWNSYHLVKKLSEELLDYIYWKENIFNKFY